MSIRPIAKAQNDAPQSRITKSNINRLRKLSTYKHRSQSRTRNRREAVRVRTSASHTHVELTIKQTIKQRANSRISHRTTRISDYRLVIDCAYYRNKSREISNAQSNRNGSNTYEASYTAVVCRGHPEGSNIQKKTKYTVESHIAVTDIKGKSMRL